MKTVTCNPFARRGFALLAQFQAGKMFTIMLIIFASSMLPTKDVALKRIGLAGGVMNTAVRLGPSASLPALLVLVLRRAAVSFAVAAVLSLSIREGGRS